MAYGFVSFVHIAALVLTIIELGLISYVISAYYGPFGGHSPSTPNFVLFDTIWCVLLSRRSLVNGADAVDNKMTDMSYVF